MTVKARGTDVVAALEFVGVGFSLMAVQYTEAGIASTLMALTPIIIILPSYWLCLAVMLAIAVADPDFSDPGRLLKDLAAHLTFTHNLFQLSYTMSRLNVVLWTLAVEAQFYLLAPLIVRVYTSAGTALYDMSVYGLRVVSLSLVIVGINVFVSGFFTCFGNGAISSLISISRGLVMLILGLLVLSRFLGLTGAWLALPFADWTTLILSFAMLARYRRRYQYHILGR